MSLRFTILSAALVAGPVWAQELTLAWPVDCRLEETCFIQQYVDRDDGPQAADFTCGPLSYDDHTGTDIALPSLAEREAGVAVLAAADGQVVGVRDAMPDVTQGGDDAPDVTGRECGNGVLLRHPGGWETQYCHLEAGSIPVAVGDVVSAGQALGRVGLSGQTEFPHLHIGVRRDGETVDPFEPSDDGACGASGPGLWEDDVAYQPGGIVGIGFSAAVPEFEAIKAGAAEAPVGQGDPMVLWGHFFGGRTGDLVRIEIRQDGRDVLTHEETLDRTQARLFRAAGRRAPPGGWPPGRYDGTVLLLRDGAEIGRRSASVTVP